MKCPECGLFNPPSALTCDCGFRLEGRSVEHIAQIRKSSFWGLTITTVGLGAVLVLCICLLYFRMSESHHAQRKYLITFMALIGAWFVRNIALLLRL